jgi:hypothetical protein
LRDIHSPAGRLELRGRWVKELVARMPPEFRTRRMREAMARMVHVATWNRRGDCFEYAHFTPRQIARAILSVYIHLAPVEERVLAERIGRLKQAGDGNFEKLLKGWAAPCPTKLEVAEALWPVLGARVRRAAQEGRPMGVPVVRIVTHALRLATRYPRHSMALER